MFALRYGMATLGIACLLAGCNTTATKTYDLKVKHDERWEKPPDDPRYNNAPESDYKKPPPKEFFRPGPGAIDQGMGGSPVQNQGSPRR